MTNAALILGTQLFERHPALDDPDIDELLVVESAVSFDRRPFHQHRIVLLVAGLRQLVARLRAEGRTVRVVRLGEELGSEAGVERLVREHGIDGLAWMSATDRGVDERMLALCERLGLRSKRYRDALFLTPAELVDEWFAAHPTPVMEDFYRWQRQRTGILMHGRQPAGGQWNYDRDNRHPLPPGGVDVPPLPQPTPDDITSEVIAEVAERFADHPGDARSFWLPVTPADARAWLRVFVAERLRDFGRYEDAMAADEPFLFHAVLTPMLNIGLVTVDEVLHAVLGEADAPLNSVEGFVRQVIGWREYMRGMYRAHPFLESVDALGLERELETWWYDLDGVPDELPEPVRIVLERVHRYGYAHHIERLMVLGNWFLLSGYAPRSVNDWFLALFVDADEWVMVPNVMGMSQYADGGLVGTKPYVSGGAYLQRMGRWWRNAQEARDSAFTEAYWAFLERHEDRLAENHRMARPLAQMRQRRDR